MNGGEFRFSLRPIFLINKLSEESKAVITATR